MTRERSAKRKGFPPNLYLDTKGYFSYRNPLNGKRKGVGKDKALAFREARQANAVIANMEPPTPLATWVTGVQQLSLAQWVIEYKPKWIKQKKPTSGTIKNAESHLTRIGAASFAWMPLKEVTTAHIAKFLEEVDTASGPGAVTNIRSRMSDMFRMAETLGLIEAGKNPTTATYTADNEVVRERLTLEQFLLVRSQSPGWMANAMNLALVTGQRVSDIAAAKFTDHQDGSWFVVPIKMQGKVRLQFDDAIRMGAINLSIAEVIKQCHNDVASQHLIHHLVKRATAMPGDAVSVSGMSNAFTELVRGAGIVPAAGRTNPSFHEIRSLAERLYREQYGGGFVQSMLGHKDARMTAKYNDLRGSGWQVVVAK